MTDQQHPITPPPELAILEWLQRFRSPEIVATQAAMRPKPPSLKEQALALTTAILDDSSRALLVDVREALVLNRRALEALDD